MQPNREIFRAKREAKGKSGLCCCDGVLPLRRGFGSEDPQRGPGDEVSLKIECVVDGGVHIEEALGRASRLILRSRRRTTWCEFSARLFLRSPCS
jgi:hypothetical protein